MDVTIDQLFEEYRNGYGIYSMTFLAVSVVAFCVIALINKYMPTTDAAALTYINELGPLILMMLLVGLISFVGSVYNVFRLARCVGMPSYEKTVMIDELPAELKRHVLGEIPENTE